MRLAKWRKEKGWTQQELADAIGCTQPYVSAIERSRAQGGYIPGPDLIVEIYKLSRGAVTPNDFHDLPSLDQLDLPIADAADAPLLEAVG